MNKYKDTWGLYPWFIEDGEILICSSDLEKFKKLSPYGKVFECIDEDNEYLALKYGKETYRVKPDLYKQVTAPAYSIGSKVRIAKSPETEAIIEDINWHYKDNIPMYFISVNGKRKSTRYKTGDLIY